VRFEENYQDVKSKHVDISLKVQKKLNIIIEDTGVGIKESDLSKLFKYFGKLKDTSNINKKGTGLGLNISKRIVESMGGEVSVESTVGKGTKFSMFVIIQVNQDPIISNSPQSSAVKLLNNSMPNIMSG
jgi:signal transduction histidine kinase